MERYCETCGKKVDTRIEIKKEIYKVYGESIEVEASVRVCPDCGEEFFDEELDSETLLLAYNIYRKRNNLLLPEEIKLIREQYGLSQRAFAKILNWGDKTIYRYENGSIQDKSHNAMLLFLKEPENMKSFVLDKGDEISEKVRNRILTKIESLDLACVSSMGAKILDRYMDKNPCEENGYRLFDYDKFCAMVLYFANNSGELLKTKLMKLLNYADMVFFKENVVSISGMKYVHLPYGPVPEYYDLLFGALAADHVAHIEVVYDNGYEKHQVVPELSVPKDVLSNDEIEVLDRVCKKFARFGSAEISEYSHKEKGYKETKQGEIISYLYAKDIVL